jgi:uncharacterized repeat protein (TIGR03803 family)
VTLQGSKTVLAAFPGKRKIPGALTVGDDGRFYATVGTGVYASSSASLFSVASAAGSEKVYPAQPIAPIFTQNLPDGTLLGIAGGPPFDLVTSDLSGEFTTLYQFPSGEAPPYTVLYASDGNYYGISILPNATAYAYRATPSGSVTNVFTFAGRFGGGYNVALIQASDGNLYGTSPEGGVSGYGSIYKLTLDGQYTLLYSFPQSANSFAPSSLIEASDGNLYGTTIGSRSQLFRITKSGNFTVVRTMNLNTDGQCVCWLIQGSDGNIYGAANMGGIYGAGDFFYLDAGLPKPRPWAQHFTPSSGSAGTKVRIWGSNLFGASVQFNGTPAVEAVNSGSNYVWTAVPEGATAGPITITTPGGTVTTTANFTVN